MLKIKQDKLKAGMVLARPVKNKNGIVLIKEDTELTDILLQRLKGMELDLVFIKGLSQPKVPKEELLSLVDRKFRKVKDEPYMDIIKNMLEEHIEGLYGQD